jgi:diguanylate cyclase (GGDEF)-like protein
MRKQATHGAVRPWWAFYLAAGALVAVLYSLLLPREHSPGSSAVFAGITLSAAIAIGLGVARNRPAQPLPWILLGLSQLAFAAGDAVYYAASYVLGPGTVPSLADLFYLGRYPLALLGLSLLARRRIEGRDVAGVLDASTITIGAALLSWLFVVSPLAKANLSTGDKVVLLAYPVLDLALLAVALRFMLDRGRRPPAFYLVTGSLLLIFAADTVYSYQTLHGTFRTGTIDVIWVAGHLALGAAALHPTMSELSAPSGRPTERSSLVRPWILLGAALIAPAALLAQGTRVRLTDVTVAAGACVVLFTLTTLRMQTLIATQRELAITDSLTGLNTRRHLETAIPPSIAKATRNDQSMALLIVDVDHFKRVNDRFGHPAGDRVLAEVAHRLRSACRPGDLLARHGGEEFALLAPRVAPNELMSLATRVRAQVADSPIAIGPAETVQITVSVGAALYPMDGSDGTDLMVRADRALYRAKALGRDRAVIGDVNRLADDVD